VLTSTLCRVVRARSEWLPAVYQHVMVVGQTAYVEELWQHLPYDSSLYADIVHRFKADPQRQVHTANCKKFLLSISDKFIAYALLRRSLCIPCISSHFRPSAQVRSGARAGLRRRAAPAEHAAPRDC
jgi:hypothetical protein